MKDLYSYDADEAGLDESYNAMFRAYTRVFQRCGVPVVPVEADSGAMGGKVSQEFMFLTDIGEDTILTCTACGYAANAERADLRKPERAPAAPGAMEEVATPGKRTIEEVAAFLEIAPQDTLKAVFYVADHQPVFVAIRGDLDVNEVKLRNALKAHELRAMSDEEVQEAGIVAGYASPVGLSGVRVVADDSAMGANLVGGANKPDAHLRNVNHGRDWQGEIVADIALARAGDACPRCEGRLDEHRAIEMGHIFRQGTVYTEALGAKFLDRDGKERPAIMGAYGIGVERLLAAAVQQNHDERGIVWPAELAPFDVHVVALNADRPEVAEAGEAVVRDLEAAGLRVLYDDREETAGVKFNDADLLGMPVRITVSPRNIAQGSVEVRQRTAEESRLVPLADTVSACREALPAV
jgi:prolyl-tRNA synthetase